MQRRVLTYIKPSDTVDVRSPHSDPGGLGSPGRTAQHAMRAQSVRGFVRFVISTAGVLRICCDTLWIK